MQTPVALLESGDSALVAVSSLSRKAVNQDACAVIGNDPTGIRGVLVADGIGSHVGAELAAAAAVRGLQETLEHPQRDLPRAWPGCFAAAAERIREAALASEYAEHARLHPDSSFGTTLLCALDEPDEVVLAYVGNGALLHLRGDFNTFPASQLLPWTALNCLNPHSRSEEGKNRLYKWLGPNPSAERHAPTVVRVSKDTRLLGDIFVVCSDGICSYDQTPIGRDAAGRIWIAGDPSLALLYRCLATFLEGGPLTDEALSATLDAYLLELDARELVSDDCTLGLIITGQARRFQQERSARRPGEGAA